MKEIKINHQKTFSLSGCVYQRGFKINKIIYKDFLNYLNRIKNKQKDYYKKLYLNSKFEITEYNKTKCIFMNLTQTEEFLRFLRKNKIPFNEKRANLKANGYLEIKNQIGEKEE